MHEQDDYGIVGQRYARAVDELMRRYGTQDVLDYGCGKRTLEAAMNRTFHVYDPAFPEYSNAPEPHDLVVCTDVLEHIEPECLDDVLDDILRCTKKAFFAVITCVPAIKSLPDGSNPHRIVMPPTWWLTEQLWPRWSMVSFTVLLQGKSFLFLGEPNQ